MKRKNYILFITFFLCVIYAVPLVQAITEFRRNGTVQAFDIIYDACITPFSRAVKLHELAVKQKLYADSISFGFGHLKDSSYDNSGLLQTIDQAQVICNEIKKGICTINRHISGDSSSVYIKSENDIYECLEKISRAASGRISDDSANTLVDDIKLHSEVMTVMLKSPGTVDAPYLFVNNLRYIFWNDKYIRPYEKELENNSVFATSVRPCMQFSYYVMFGDLGEKGIKGKTGWFFYRPDVDFLVRPYVLDKRSVAVDPNDKPVSDNPVIAIKKFKDQLQEYGIDLLVVIVPGKPDIYPDMLAKSLTSSDAGTFGNSLRMLDELNREGVETADLFLPFARERMNDSVAGDSMYLHKDTHWTARALALSAHIIAEKIKRYPWYTPGTTEYVVDTVEVERTGDVAVMSTLTTFNLCKLPLSFASEKTKCCKVFQIFRDSVGMEKERRPYKDNFHSSQILILGDSFSRIYQTDEPRSAGLISHIALELSQPVASIVNDGGASTLVRQSLARRGNLLKGKKLVVWEIVERDFRFGSEGWKDVPLQISQKND
jgi:hypothetical protein